MAELIYAANTSLDGYIEDAEGSFAWSEPDPEVHAFIGDMERTIGTSLYGRRLYDTMAVWETWEPDEPYMREYGEIWRAHEKVVYSRTLEEPRTARTRIERDFDPDAVRRMKDEATQDLSVGGAELAAQALKAGVVDRIRLFVHPVIVGGGKAALPYGLRLDLELIGERRFPSGIVDLHYRVGGPVSR